MMMRKMAIVYAIGAASLMVASAALAQESATLTLRSGERVSGDLVDMNGSGFAMKINGQDRQIPASDVASIEFVGGTPSADVATQLSQGQQVVVMRNGSAIQGRLSDVGGTHPLRLTVDTPSGQRDLSSSDVAQVYYALPPGVAAAGAPGAVATAGTVPAGAIQVQGNQPWTNTGITVRRGQRVVFNTSGQIAVAPGAPAGPGGNTDLHGNYPVPAAPVGALIGRVGTGMPFAIGSNNGAITMPANGPLMLGINDDNHADNSGFFAVTVMPQ